MGMGFASQLPQGCGRGFNERTPQAWCLALGESLTRLRRKFLSPCWVNMLDNVGLIEVLLTFSLLPSSCISTDDVFFSFSFLLLLLGD